MKRIFTTIVSLGVCCGALRAEETPAKVRGPHDSGEFSVAFDDLGDTGRVVKGPHHPDWYLGRCLVRNESGLGVMLYMMKGSFLEVSLLTAVPITAVELTSLDVYDSCFIKTVDIYVDGELVKKGVELGNTVEEVKDNQGRVRQRLAPKMRVDMGGVKGRVVGIDVTDIYPPRVTDPAKEPNKNGGFSRIRIYSSEDMARYLEMPANYKVADERAVAFSAALASKPEVFAEVRNVGKTNPNTIWDKQDIERMKGMLVTSEVMQKQFETMKKRLDLRMEQPFGIPAAKKDDKGEWRHVSDQEGGNFGVHNRLANDICDLGIVYALSGEEKYAEFAKRFLLAYSDEYQNYRPGNRPGFQHDLGMMFDQRLSDATWLLRAIRGYDLIYNLPSITPEERKRIEDDFLKHLAYYIAANRYSMMAPTNWSAICTAAILLTGYATHDEELVDKGKYGWKNPNDGSRRGGMYLHFGEESIDVDGMWAEGAMGYQFMALHALIAYAETMLHHSENMYAYRDGAMKHLFDSPVWFAYPDLTTPGIHDSSHGSIFSGDSGVWEYAYLRYRDPNYLTLLKQIPLQLHSRFQMYADSVLYDVDKEQPTPPITTASMNLHGVGYGITRVNAGEKGQRYILFDYGPNRSHGHPDKLNVDIWANGEQLVPDPGIVWYEQPIYRKWYNKSIAHNTLVVDETCQQAADGVQTVFAPGETVAMQRAYAREAVPGVTMDRAFFMFEDYVLDIFGAFAQVPRLYDLAWHIRGDFELPEGMKEREKMTAAGYMEIDDVKKLTTKDAFSVAFTSPERKAKSRYISAPGVETTYITGLGVHQKEHALAIIQRRNAADTIYCAALDYSGTGDYVNSVSGSGDMEKGFYLAKAVTRDGTDLGYASFNGSTNTADALTTDALQALVRLDDKGEVYTAALAGGKTLEHKTPGLFRGKTFNLDLGEKGNVIIERTSAGTWLITNLDNSEVTLTLKANFAKGLDIAALNPDGSHAVANPLPFKDTVTLPPLGKFELLPKGGDGYHKAALKIREAYQAAEERLAAEAKAAPIARNKDRREAAAAVPVKGFSVEIPAVDFVAEKGGAAQRVTDKAAVKSKNGSVNIWQGTAHALTWEVEVPADGYYVLGARYCTELNGTRKIEINGAEQEPYSPFLLPSTNGWSRASDDWKLVYATDKIDGKPLFIKLNKGKNTITLTSNDGFGVNLDYLLVASLEKVVND